jgi:hypothetical protein
VIAQTMKNEKYGKAFYTVLATVALICAFFSFRSAQARSNVMDFVILSQIFLIRAEMEGKSK